MARRGSSPAQVAADAADRTRERTAIPTRAPKLETRSEARLRQADPPGPVLEFALDPESVVPGGGVGGWDEVTHPRRESSTEWAGTSLRTLSVTLVLDSNRLTDHVERGLRQLEVWGRRLTPTSPHPPVLVFEWGYWGVFRWVLNGLAFGDTVHDLHGGRTRQLVTVELLEFRTPELTLTPAQRAAPAPAPAGAPGKPSSGPAPAPSGRVYTVKSGDTLGRIAQRELGNAARWPELARLNGLRDPDRITVGQRLRLPA